jgi:small subunit ribosomal protein S20
MVRWINPKTASGFLGWGKKPLLSQSAGNSVYPAHTGVSNPFCRDNLPIRSWQRSVFTEDNWKRYNSLPFFFQEDILANLKSAIKRIRSNEKKRVRNRIIRSRARSAVSNAKEEMQTKGDEAALRLAIRELDKAASKGIIHKNNAARRKSRLFRELNSLKKQKKTKA